MALQQISPVKNNQGVVVAYQLYEDVNNNWTYRRSQAIPANNKEDAQEWNALTGMNIPVPANSRYQTIAQQQVARPASVIAAETEAQQRAATETARQKQEALDAANRAAEAVDALRRQEAARKAAEMLATQQAQAQAAAVAEAKKQETLAAAARKQQEFDAERIAQEQKEVERRTTEQAAQSQPVCCGLVAVGGPVTTPAVLATPAIPTMAEVVPTDSSQSVDVVEDVKPPTAPVEPSSGIPLWAIAIAIILFFAAVYFGWKKGD